MNIKKKILLKIKKELILKDRIIMLILKKYTLKIYNMGFRDGFNWEENRFDHILSTKTKI